MNASPPSRVRHERQHAPPESAYLFSDLNQWMLKVLLAPLVPAELLRAPRREYRNASELAAANERGDQPLLKAAQDAAARLQSQPAGVVKVIKSAGREELRKVGVDLPEK